MENQKCDGAFLTMEQLHRQQWAFSVTVRRGFVKKLLRFLGPDINRYLHLPIGDTRTVRVYNTTTYYVQKLAKWLIAKNEPFDLVRPGDITHGLRFDDEGSPVLFWDSPEEPTDKSTMVWDNQEFNRKLYLTEKLLET